MSWSHRSIWVVCSRDGSAVPIREAVRVKGKLQQRCQAKLQAPNGALSRDRGTCASGHRAESVGLSEQTWDFEQCSSSYFRDFYQ